MIASFTSPGYQIKPKDHSFYMKSWFLMWNENWRVQRQYYQSGSYLPPPPRILVIQKSPHPSGLSEHLMRKSLRWPPPAWARNMSIFNWKDHVYHFYELFKLISAMYLFNDSKAENRGQPVLELYGPSPPSCFGSNEGFESSFITAERGGGAWLRVP